MAPLSSRRAPAGERATGRLLPGPTAPSGVGGHLEAELADVEVERLVLVEDVDEVVCDGSEHGGQPRRDRRACLLRNCSMAGPTPSRCSPGPRRGWPPAARPWSTRGTGAAIR